MWWLVLGFVRHTSNLLPHWCRRAGVSDGQAKMGLNKVGPIDTKRQRGRESGRSSCRLTHVNKCKYRMPLYVFGDIVLAFHFWHDRILVSFPTPNNVQSDIILHSGAQYTHIINNMRFSVPPHVIIILFVISAGRCFLIAATPDHSVPEQQEDRILQDTPLENDVDPCSSSCDSSATSDIAASLDIQVEEQDGEEEDSDGIFGGLLGRLMNGFFKMFKRHQEDGPKYTVRTESIAPLLEESSTKFKSLADLIMQESVTDAALSTTPDTIKKLYTAATENIMLVATVIDPIVDNMRLHPTMDIRSIGCDLTRVLTLLRDVTVPNIKLMGKLLHTKSNDAATKFTIDQFIDTSTSTPITTSFAALTTLSCSQFDESSTTTTTSRLFLGEIDSIGDLINFLFNDSVQVGPIGNIVAVILILLLFPISIVVSIVVTALSIFIALFIAILLLLTQLDGDDDGGLIIYPIILILGATLFAIGSPILLIIEILENIREFFSPFVLSSITSERSAVQQANEVKRRILVALDSPIETIVTELGSNNNLLDTTDEEEGKMDCEMSELKCNTEALNEILPF